MEQIQERRTLIFYFKKACNPLTNEKEMHVCLQADNSIKPCPLT